MKVEYDKYYQTLNLFGEPYPELIDFYSSIDQKGSLLDIGCGQGRDSIPLARLGFEVTGLDNSQVGIEQLNEIAKVENLPLVGLVEDIFTYADFNKFDFILMDSMFHFGKKEREKEISFLKLVIETSKIGCLITICIQSTGNKVQTLNSIFSTYHNLDLVHRTQLVYKYEDKKSKHSSETNYEMVTVKKIN